MPNWCWNNLIISPSDSDESGEGMKRLRAKLMFMLEDMTANPKVWGGSYDYLVGRENDWDEMKDVLRNVVKGQKEVVAIGSGGNINKIFSMSKRKDGKPLSLELLRDYHKELSNAILSERTLYYGLRTDRADVIVPALLIYINVMRWAGAEQIYVPKIGLADGLIKHLWEKVKDN